MSDVVGKVARKIGNSEVASKFTAPTEALTIKDLAERFRMPPRSVKRALVKEGIEPVDNNEFHKRYPIERFRGIYLAYRPTRRQR